MKRRFSVFIAFLAGTLLGILGTYLWYQKLEADRLEFENFPYGVVSNTVVGTGVEWKEYPQFRTVELSLHGELVVELPKGGQLIPEGLVDETTFKEVSRKSGSGTDGENILEFEEVTYLFEKARIKANLPNVYGAEEDALCGYELVCTGEDENIVVGYIVPMCKEFHICTKEQTANWEYPQNLEFDLLKLSRTYLDEDVTRVMERAPEICVERMDDTYDIRIRNEGNVQWGYSTMVASLEVWNQGVWMELQTIFGNPCMGAYLNPGESEDYLWTASMLESLPYQAPGIYRIVVYGAYEDEGTFAASESFVIK